MPIQLRLGKGMEGMQEITLPSCAQQGQKERGLRRGVPALGSTSIGPKMGKEEGRGRGSWKWEGREEKQGENKQTSKRTKKHKSEKERKQQEESRKEKIKEMEKQKQGEQVYRRNVPCPHK